MKNKELNANAKVVFFVRTGGYKITPEHIKECLKTKLFLCDNVIKEVLFNYPIKSGELMPAFTIEEVVEWDELPIGQFESMLFNLKLKTTAEDLMKDSADIMTTISVELSNRECSVLKTCACHVTTSFEGDNSMQVTIGNGGSHNSLLLIDINQ